MYTYFYNISAGDGHFQLPPIPTASLNTRASSPQAEGGQPGRPQAGPSEALGAPPLSHAQTLPGVHSPVHRALPGRHPATLPSVQPATHGPLPAVAGHHPGLPGQGHPGLPGKPHPSHPALSGPGVLPHSNPDTSDTPGSVSPFGMPSPSGPQFPAPEFG